MRKAISHILAGRQKAITPEESVLQPLPHKDFRSANPFIALHHLKRDNAGHVQLWINVPKAHIWDEPFYQSATRDQQPRVLQQDGVDLRLATGEYDNATGPLKSFTPIIIISGTISQGERLQFTATPGYWTLIYLIKGRSCINQESISAYNLVVFEQAGEEIILTAEENSQILFLSAEPITEPVAAKGNLVMNTQEEIEQVIADYNDGIFGTLPY